jgi:hypothetical protein
MLAKSLNTSGDLKAIEKHTNKCFENINSFILQDELARERQLEKEAQKAIQSSQEAGFESKKSNNTGNHNSRKAQENDNHRPKPAVKIIGNSIDTESEHLDHPESTDIYGIKSAQ